MNESRKKGRYVLTPQGRKALLANLIRPLQVPSDTIAARRDTARTREASPMTVQAGICFGINDIADCIWNLQKPTQQAVMSFVINRIGEYISHARLSLAEEPVGAPTLIKL